MNSTNPFVEPTVLQPGAAEARGMEARAIESRAGYVDYSVMTTGIVRPVVPQPGMSGQALAVNPYLETAASHPEVNPTDRNDAWSYGFGPETENVPNTRYWAVDDEVTGIGHDDRPAVMFEGGPDHDIRSGPASARLGGRKESQGRPTGPPPPPPPPRRAVTRSMTKKNGK